MTTQNPTRGGDRGAVAPGQDGGDCPWTPGCSCGGVASRHAGVEPTAPYRWYRYAGTWCVHGPQAAPGTWIVVRAKDGRTQRVRVERVVPLGSEPGRAVHVVRTEEEARLSPEAYLAVLSATARAYDREHPQHYHACQRCGAPVRRGECVECGVPG
jgi:hypothetical protein